MIDKDFLIEYSLTKKYGAGNYYFTDPFNKNYKTLALKSNIKLTEKEFEQVLFEGYKNYKIERFSLQTTSYIEKYYSQLKQRSDVVDKEYWGAWLIAHFPSVYTTDNLYQKIFKAAASVVEGQNIFDTAIENLKELTSFPDTETQNKYYIALDQLLKVAIRQGWVQECKKTYYKYKKQIEESTSLEALDLIEINLPAYILKDN